MYKYRFFLNFSLLLKFFFSFLNPSLLRKCFSHISPPRDFYSYLAFWFLIFRINLLVDWHITHSLNTASPCFTNCWHLLSRYQQYKNITVKQIHLSKLDMFPYYNLSLCRREGLPHPILTLNPKTTFEPGGFKASSVAPAHFLFTCCIGARST